MFKHTNKFNFAISIPTFNNYKDIRKLSLSFKQTNLKNYFICFVDDSSSDKVLSEIKKYFKKNYIVITGPNLKNGRCAAVKRGFEWIIKNIKTDILIEMDSDLSYDPKDLLKAIDKKFQRFDLILGSKYLNNSISIKRSFLRNFLSLIVTKISRLFFKSNVTDFTNGYRIYKRNFYKRISKKNIETDSPLENLNIVLYSLYLKARITEFPASYVGNSRSHWSTNIIGLVKLSLKTIYLILYYFFKINFSKK
jgi:dolichol-phosphate mannosyltransferase